VLKLDQNCEQMLQIMKKSHEMLEVTDLTKPAEVTESLNKLKSTINANYGSVDTVQQRYGYEMVRGAVKQVKLKQMVIRAFQSIRKEHAAVRIQRKFRARKQLKEVAAIRIQREYRARKANLLAPTTVPTTMKIAC